MCGRYVVSLASLVLVAYGGGGPTDAGGLGLPGLATLPVGHRDLHDAAGRDRRTLLGEFSFGANVVVYRR